MKVLNLLKILGFFKGIANKIQNTVETVTTGVETKLEEARDALSRFIDAIAVLIITSCVIPILVLFFFIWIVKMIFGINVNIPKPPKFHPFKEKTKGIDTKTDE